MDAGECFLASSGQDERNPWPLDLNLPLCPSTTKDTPLLPPSPSPDSSTSSSASTSGRGCRAVSPTSSVLQPPLLASPSPLNPTYLPKLLPPAESNCQEEKEDEGEAFLGHVLFSSDGSVYLLKGEGEEEGALPPSPLLRDSPNSTVLPHSPLTSFRLTATYQGFCSNQISRHTSAQVASVTQTAPGTSSSNQDQPKEKEAGEKGGEDGKRHILHGESHRTQRVDGVWICLPCQLTFRHGGNLGCHALRFHGLDHPYQDQLAGGEASGIVHSSSGQLFLSLLEPKIRRKVLESGQEPDSVGQNTPILDEIPTLPEQPGASNDITSTKKRIDTKSQDTCKSESNSQLSQGLVPHSPLKYDRCESTGTHYSTEAKDSILQVEKNDGATWCPKVTEAQGEGGEEEREDEGESSLPTSQPSDIAEQLLTNQSFYAQMLTSSFTQIGSLHGVDKRGDQNEERGPQAHDDCVPAPGSQSFQSISLQGQLSLLHSRNSCKTLKCPKCNWHYKYQQTLDVHMKEKHPESHSHCTYCHSGQQHPRLARGESYNCGYKPYRCEACNYSTTTKGNLTIHMQSDKHLANLQGYQGSGTTTTTSAPTITVPTITIGQGEGDQTSLPDRQIKQKASWHCKVCNYETNISRNLRIHMTSEKHMQNVLLLHQGLGLGQDSFPFYGGPIAPEQGLEHPLLFNPMAFNSSGSQACNLLTQDTSSGPQVPNLGASSTSLSITAPQDSVSSAMEEEPSPGVFRCLVCRCFTTDSLEGLLSHASRGRSLPEREWREVRGDLHCCRLCSYSTQLKANFQLHLKTDKHAQKYQLAAHMREGGAALAAAQASAAELPISGYSQASSFPPLHVRCNLCGFESNSREKMQLHVQGGSHEESLRVYKFLQSIEGGGSDVCFRCAPCESSVGSRLGMVSHLRSANHHQNLAQWRLTHGETVLEGIISFCRNPPQELAKPQKSPEPTSNQEHDEENQEPPQAPTQDETSRSESETSAEGTTVFCCPFCTYVSPSEDHVRSHAVSQHALQPTFRCPLCQEKLTGTANLRGHLGHGHNVVTECVEKLLQVAQKVEITFRTRILPLRIRDETESTSSEMRLSSEAPHLAPEVSPPLSPGEDSSNAADVSEAVADSEKPPEENSCPLCRQSHESIQDLKTHLEKEHPELSPSDIQHTCEIRQRELETGEAEDRKGGQENILLHSQQATYRKTTNFAMDKFMDPSRPHKCVVCKESFTQKNILLVHFNSVSHLHKVRKASLDPSLSTRQESGAGTSGHGVQTGQDKPYKCTVCHVSYNQSSTLEIHMRSVLHQTRSRGTKQDLGRVPSEKTQRETCAKSENTSDLRAEAAHDLQVAEASKKRHPQISSCLGVPIIPANVASSVQLAIDLPRPPPLVQPPPLFAPSLLPSFPLIPEAILKLQRQQQHLLLPFYLQELKVGDGGNAPLLSFGSAPQPLPIKEEGGQPSVPQKSANEKEERVLEEPDAATVEAEASQNPESRVDASTKAGDLTGSAARALLENFGFELVTQYNEGRQPSICQTQPQPQPPAPPPDVPPAPTSAEKLQCGTCGKHFSNRLILKTHEEHMHQRLLPFEALSRYAAHYRRSYDSHYPSGLNTETESSLAPLDFSITSKSHEVEEQDTTYELGLTVEQLSFLCSLLDLPNHPIEEQFLWAAEKTGLSLAIVRQWYKQREKGKVIQEGQEDESEELFRGDRFGNRRFSRTKFSDFQMQSLSSFFESSAYPRDSEVEHLSGLLGLPARVVVVWFQNARQKARKQAAETGTSPTSPLHSNPQGERPASNSKVPPCRKCGVTLPCIFQLIRHLKGCYSEQNDEVGEEENEEETKTTPKVEVSLSDEVIDIELSSGKKQEEEEEEEEEEEVRNGTPEEEVIEASDTKIPEAKLSTETQSPTINEEKLPEKNDQDIPHNELSVIDKPPEHNQNKQVSNTGHLVAPLMDLPLLIPLGHGDMGLQRKRKHEEESLSPTGSEGGDEPPRDKRLRTTILPEQLDILHRWYLQDSNPTRSSLERISHEVGLKKRVVQVWFQNTRARERKGQYRGVAPATVSATRQQDDTVTDGSKKDVATNYFYSVAPSQVAPSLSAKTGQTTSPILSKAQAPSGLGSTAITNKSIVSTTKALSGLLNTNQILPNLVTQPQAIPGLTSSTQALTNLVSTPQALTSLVNPTQAFPSLVNPAQVLSGIVNTTQASPGLLLASFTTKAVAPPLLLSAATEAKTNTTCGLLVSSSAEKMFESDKTSALTTPTKVSTAESKIYHQAPEVLSCENQSFSSHRTQDDKATLKHMEFQMHSPQGGDLSDDSGSDPGPSSPGKSGINSDGMLGSSGSRRYRTQMSSLQLRILKACYSEYRTPSMQECDCLGGEIGLQKRVVQVWFQNARAKEKKARLQGLGGTSTSEGPQPTECTHCNVKYGPTTPCRAHIFSRQHIARLKLSIQQQLKEESRYRDIQPSGGASSGQENKQTSQIPSFQAGNTVTPQIQRLTPLLMPGQGIPAPIGGLATFNAGPPPSLLGMASSVPPALLPRAAPPAPSSSHSNDTSMDTSQSSLTPEVSAASALKSASLLGAPFMPFPLAPAAAPLFTPQLQAPYFQQLYGLKKRLFPINPVIPHTLLGLLPAPLKPTPDNTLLLNPECPQTKATNERNVGQEEMLMGEEETVEKDDDLDDEDIPMVDVAMRYQCQRCKASYEEEGEAEAHQRAGCYSGPPPHPPPLRLRVCTYHCLSCQVLLQGSAARSQHLRSQQHRAHNMCGDGASSAIPQLRPKSAATSVLMAL